MVKIFVCLTCIFLSSCAYKPIENFRWVKVYEPTGKIVFIKHENPDKYCRKLGANTFFWQKIFACALNAKDVCFIITEYDEPNIPSYIRAHEELHCLGWIHD